jgi:adenylyl-sulfate kinase
MRHERARFENRSGPPAFLEDRTTMHTTAGNGALRQLAGFTLWLTGLSGAGKSTLAAAVAARLRRDGIAVELLDGDEVRLNLSKGLGFSREDRDTNVRRIGYVAKLLTRNGVAVIPAAISPYRAVRDEVRREIGAFVEVHVKATLDECIRRDIKGLYRKALAGEIPQFTGVSDPYEAPERPELVVDTEQEDVETSAARVIECLITHGYLRHGADA